jgi:hypothetical protein
VKVDFALMQQNAFLALAWCPTQGTFSQDSDLPLIQTVPTTNVST